MARLLFAWTMARIAFVEAWRAWPAAQLLARVQLHRIGRREATARARERARGAA